MQSLTLRLEKPPAAFTLLLKECVERREWEKAVEVFRGMERYQGVVPNRVHYSTLIDVFARDGRWKEALQVPPPPPVLYVYQQLWGWPLSIGGGHSTIAYGFHSIVLWLCQT